jgi:defect-in-organelle-trafficking protein DotD
MKVKIFLVASLFFLLTGCEDEHAKIVNLHLKYITTNSAPEPSVNRNAQYQLAETATSVGHSLQTLSAIQVATHPGTKMPQAPNPESIGMAQVSSIDWTGPVEPLLKKIADASQYHVRVLGKRPAIPVIVAVSANNEALANILRDTTYQVAKKATIKLYPSSRIIELRYFPS